MATPVFVKVSPWTAKKLNLDRTRIRMADGNYLLYQTDLLVFGPLFRLREYAARIGGAVMSDREAAANQRGEMTTALPAATDPEWMAPDDDDEAIIEEIAEEIVNEAAEEAAIAESAEEGEE